MARVLVLGVAIAGTHGGAELLVKTLAEQIGRRGHDADILSLPYDYDSKAGLLNQAAIWRATDVSSYKGRRVDRVIATKFPSYFVRHPNKAVWLVHQHRELYDLYGTEYCGYIDDPRDEQVRRMLTSGDTQVLAESSYISSISKRVTARLKKFNGLDSEVLYPPLPLGDRYACKPAENFILSVGRIASIKRVDMLVEALQHVHPLIDVKAKIVGVPDSPKIGDMLHAKVAEHGLADRVEFLGKVGEEDLLDLFSRALGVYYAPHEEDYGYVTLEAFASQKPVITAIDSGGVLEFVKDGVNGVICEPTAVSVAEGIERIATNKNQAAAMGAAGRELIENSGLLGNAWDESKSGG